MRANFEDAYRGLAPAAARLLRLLSLPPGDGVGPAAAAALADVPEPEARDLLDALAAHGLVTASGERFRLADDVRDKAREHAGRDESEAALRRLLDHTLASAVDDDFQGVALLDRERWSEAADVMRENLDRAEAGGDRREILRARLDLARALTETGDLDRAIGLLGQLPDEFAALPDPDGHERARALTALGEAYLRADRPVAATNFFGQALEILRKDGTPEEQAAMFVHIADAAHQRADHAAETAALLQAGDLVWDEGDELG
ncbi:tetratricopeptide repeat protein [Actinomadura bangladeshensis]|uniref:Tetratricopeptide repeat protein n=1 Tax=Actinomadura bangladeshensis TaxID=453573 RepID=A0A6L9QFU6_9ACTN|nr:tetratricopeptide repeat protein [Actinomadura bangladeshensis]NEA24379.1 tetratricopeptide repeat protein [Actinomadura bangladeshensis]